MNDSHTGWRRPQILSMLPTVVMWEIVFSCTRAASNEIQTSLSRTHLEHAFDCVAEEMQYQQCGSEITKAERKKQRVQCQLLFDPS